MFPLNIFYALLVFRSYFRFRSFAFASFLVGLFPSRYFSRRTIRTSYASFRLFLFRYENTTLRTSFTNLRLATTAHQARFVVFTRLISLAILLANEFTKRIYRDEWNKWWQNNNKISSRVVIAASAISTSFLNIIFTGFSSCNRAFISFCKYS